MSKLTSFIILDHHSLNPPKLLPLIQVPRAWQFIKGHNLLRDIAVFGLVCSSFSQGGYNASRGKSQLLSIYGGSY